MWPLIRAAALLALTLLVVLLIGRGAWLLTTLAEVTGPDMTLLPQGGGPPPPVVVGGLAVGATGTALRPLRRIVDQAVTLLHELGHTLVAAALGARPAGIVLRHDASGHATARWRHRSAPRRRLSLALTALVGLPAPAVAAAASTRLLTLAGPRPGLWAVAIAGAVVAVLARSAWALLVAVVLAGAAAAALTEAAEAVAAGGLIALVTAVALTSAVGAAGRLGRPIASGDDARAVHRELRVPPRLVLAAQAAITVVAAAWALWPLLATAAAELLRPS